MRHIERLVSQGLTSGEILTETMSFGVSKATAWRYIAKARETIDARPKLRPETGIAMAISATDSPVVAGIDPNNPALRYMAAASDMAKLRENAMDEGTKSHDPRIAIAAATAEANILMAATKAIKELRDASADNIAMHPQHAKFREELLLFFDDNQEAREQLSQAIGKFIGDHA